MFAGETGLTLSEAVVGVRLGVGKHLGVSCGDHLSGLQTQEHHHLQLSEVRPLLLKCLFSAQYIMCFISEAWLGPQPTCSSLMPPVPVVGCS